MAHSPTDVWQRPRWEAAEQSHHQAVDAVFEPHLARVARGERHPVHDFLFHYYRLRPSQLRAWHPGAGVGLVDAADHGARRFYLTRGSGATAVTFVDVELVVRERADTVTLIRRILRGTTAATPHFSCFGLHEWAMVYESPEVRHAGVPLRLGAAGTDTVVRDHPLRCTHFDAFRFFTDGARPLNNPQPTVWSRAGLEQPACLHANMDLYKWAYKLLPLTPSSLVLACFRLAAEIRVLDMRASPYDLSEYDYSPVRIETPDGKAEYVAAQREFAARAAGLRAELLTLVENLPAASTKA
jgi:hypothetical protein